MDKHLDAVVVPHVHVDVLEGRSGISILELTCSKADRLLILGLQVRGTKKDLTINSRRNHIRNRRTLTILFKVYRGQVKVGIIVGIIIQIFAWYS